MNNNNNEVIEIDDDGDCKLPPSSSSQRDDKEDNNEISTNKNRTDTGGSALIQIHIAATGTVQSSTKRMFPHTNELNRTPPQKRTYRPSTGSTPDTPNSDSPFSTGYLEYARVSQSYVPTNYVPVFRPLALNYDDDEDVFPPSSPSTTTGSPGLAAPPVVAQLVVPPVVAPIVRKFDEYLKEYPYDPIVSLRRGNNLLNPSMYNQVDITPAWVEVWRETSHPVRLKNVEVLTGLCSRTDAYYPTPIPDRPNDGRRLILASHLRDIGKDLVNEAKMEDLDTGKKRLFLIGYLTKTNDEGIQQLYAVMQREERNNIMINNIMVGPGIEQKRLFLIGYLTKINSDVVNTMYLVAKKVESMISTIPFTIDGMPTRRHGKPKMVVINLTGYVPHTELELPHAMEQRACTCALFDHNTLQPIERNDNKMYYEKYPENTVTIAIVNEKREFGVRKFITNIDPGVSGIMINPHYEDPQYDVVNGPDAIPGACYMKVDLHWMKIIDPPPLQYNLEGLSVMYTGKFKPLRGIVGVIEANDYPDAVVVLLESVVDYPENRLIVHRDNLVVIYREYPNDLNRGEVVRRAWPSKLNRR